MWTSHSPLDTNSIDLSWSSHVLSFHLHHIMTWCLTDPLTQETKKEDLWCNVTSPNHEPQPGSKVLIVFIVLIPTQLLLHVQHVLQPLGKIPPWNSSSFIQLLPSSCVSYCIGVVPKEREKSAIQEEYEPCPVCNMSCAIYSGLMWLLSGVTFSSSAKFSFCD